MTLRLLSKHHIEELMQVYDWPSTYLGMRGLSFRICHVSVLNEAFLFRSFLFSCLIVQFSHALGTNNGADHSFLRLVAYAGCKEHKVSPHTDLSLLAIVPCSSAGQGIWLFLLM